MTVEGFAVGRLAGLAFSPAKGSSALEQKALRRAAERVVGPEVNRRLGALAADRDAAFGLAPDGFALWRGEAAGAIASAAIRSTSACGCSLNWARKRRASGARGGWRPRRRSRPTPAALRRLSRAVADGAVTGLARAESPGALTEAGGVIDRRTVEADLTALSRVERRALKRFGVRIDTFCLSLPIHSGQHEFATAFAEHLPAAKADALAGCLRLGEIAVEISELEALSATLRAAPRLKGGRVLADLDPRSISLLRALGFSCSGKPGEPRIWRRRREVARPQVAPHSPFAALAGLEAKAPPRRRTRRG